VAPALSRVATPGVSKEQAELLGQRATVVLRVGACSGLGSRAGNSGHSGHAVSACSQGSLQRGRDGALAESRATQACAVHKQSLNGCGRAEAVGAALRHSPARSPGLQPERGMCDQTLQANTRGSAVTQAVGSHAGGRQSASVAPRGPEPRQTDPRPTTARHLQTSAAFGHSIANAQKIAIVDTLAQVVAVVLVPHAARHSTKALHTPRAGSLQRVDNPGERSRTRGSKIFKYLGGNTSRLRCGDSGGR
jgi:hypothetical protein